MLRISSCILLALFICCASGTDAEEQNKQITTKVVTNENFQLVINQAGLGTFIMFSAPWCGHCKRMLPIWSELSATHNSESKFIIARVDCTIDTELCSSEDILGYPTFAFYKKGDSVGHRYTSEDLSYQSFELFMFDQISDQNTEFIDTSVAKQFHSLTADNFDAFISKGFHFVKFFAPWCGHCKKMEQIWKDLVGVNEKVVISEVDCTVHHTVCAKQQVRGYPTILFFHNGQKIDHYRHDRRTELFVVFMDQWVSKLDTQAAIKDLEDIDVKDEKVKEAKPVVDNSISIVMEITDKNQQTVFGHRCLLFVKFFAPWCGHCKNMAQDWIDLANKFANAENVIIAEVDCTKFGEICSNYDVKGYPTLLLFKDGKRIENYNGGRDVNSLSAFLTPHLVKYHDDL